MTTEGNWAKRASDGSSIAISGGRKYIAYRNGELRIIDGRNIVVGSLRTATQAGARSIANDMTRND